MVEEVNSYAKNGMNGIIWFEANHPPLISTLEMHLKGYPVKQRIAILAL